MMKGSSFLGNIFLPFSPNPSSGGITMFYTASVYAIRYSVNRRLCKNSQGGIASALFVCGSFFGCCWFDSEYGFASVLADVDRDFLADHIANGLGFAGFHQALYVHLGGE